MRTAVVASLCASLIFTVLHAHSTTNDDKQIRPHSDVVLSQNPPHVIKADLPFDNARRSLTVTTGDIDMRLIASTALHPYEFQVRARPNQSLDNNQSDTQLDPTQIDGIDYMENSRLSADHLFLLAASGNSEALNAFVANAPGTADYMNRSIHLLRMHAASGDVFALQTLSEWAMSGFGFASPDFATATAFEYVAWMTGKWGGERLALPDHLRADLDACARGIALGDAFSSGKPWVIRNSSSYINATELCLAPS